MSDYLWDKTGEAEEDVEQLENLLGTLRYQPRPLEIPATAMPTVARPRTMMIFSRPRLAIAASLLLTLLAGTWFVTRQTKQPSPDRLAEVEQKGERQKEQVAEVEQKSSVVGSEKLKAAIGSEDGVRPIDMARAYAPLRNDGVRVKPRAVKEVFITATPKAHRAPRRLIAKRQKLQPRVEENTPAPREEVAINSGGMRWQVEQPMTAQQREATEQLMLALRLASAKFNYAQREMQEIGRAGK